MTGEFDELKDEIFDVVYLIETSIDNLDELIEECDKSGAKLELEYIYEKFEELKELIRKIPE